MFIVVTYDITDDKRRTNIFKTMKDFGTRVQYSVFECILTEKVLEKMLEELLKYIHKDEDSIRIYTLCGGCLKNTQLFGKSILTEDEDVYIV
ncbi:MAG TPA: CRISPR-associated endonuclease Cas2 [Candidatus Brocadiia bacterium]|nr:CRISPR-associated endonuclease Cas2 [Candidatus Brocadiales bacterium]